MRHSAGPEKSWAEELFAENDQSRRERLNLPKRQPTIQFPLKRASTVPRVAFVKHICNRFQRTHGTRQEGVSIGEDNLVTCGPSRVRHNKVRYPPGTKQAKQEHAISNPQQYLQPVWISLPEIPRAEKKADGCGRTGQEASQIRGAAACPGFGSRRGCSNGRAEPSRETRETQQPEIARLRRLSQMHRLDGVHLSTGF